MTEIVQHQQQALAIGAEQVTFTREQRAVLAHMGVENAPEADLRVFMHVCQRAGLDPFARQIHMIGRNSKNDRTQQWETKYTIQTGIDGYRLIGRRAADRVGARISLGQPEWAHEDGSWRPVWSGAWGLPVAARVTIMRDGEPFTAVALFDEYKQTKRNGDLTRMWSQRPAGQLAKCAEALAWRMAFPQDLSGIYTDDEMAQADRTHSESEQPQAPKVTAADFMVPDSTPPDPIDAKEAQAFEAELDSLPVADPAVQDAEVVVEPDVDSRLTRRMFAAFREAGFTDDARTEEGRNRRLEYIARVIGRQVSSSKDLTGPEVAQVVDALEADAQDAQWTDEAAGGVE
ncbi:MAG: phage recombination protein Bet [Streptomycetaceae bacterium]|nr:phage recombination protein Bet [Streptomycetaceae bacterium]